MRELLISAIEYVDEPFMVTSMLQIPIMIMESFFCGINGDHIVKKLALRAGLFEVLERRRFAL